MSTPIPDLIKAWASGAVIQVRNKAHPDWIDTGPVGEVHAPNWSPQAEYRLKPEATTRYLPVMEGEELLLTCSVSDLRKVKRRYPHVRKAVKVVINPVDMTLVSAEMVEV